MIRSEPGLFDFQAIKKVRSRSQLIRPKSVLRLIDFGNQLFQANFRLAFLLFKKWWYSSVKINKGNRSELGLFEIFLTQSLPWASFFELYSARYPSRFSDLSFVFDEQIIRPLENSPSKLTIPIGSKLRMNLPNQRSFGLPIIDNQLSFCNRKAANE